eukprot:7391816-Prymnesium_polylepis.3
MRSHLEQVRDPRVGVHLCCRRQHKLVRGNRRPPRWPSTIERRQREQRLHAPSEAPLVHSEGALVDEETIPEVVRNEQVSLTIRPRRRRARVEIRVEEDAGWNGAPEEVATMGVDNEGTLEGGPVHQGAKKVAEPDAQGQAPCLAAMPIIGR